MNEWMNDWRRDKSAVLRAAYWRARAGMAESVVAICFRRRTRNRAEHIRGLEAKIQGQAEQIRQMQLSAEYHNMERKALNILVACDGPCNSPYMDDPSVVTEAVVKMVERNAARLRRWWDRGGQAACEAYRRHVAELIELHKARGSQCSPPE